MNVGSVPLRKSWAVALAALSAAGILAAEVPTSRNEVSLNGDWLFQRDKAGSNEWKSVRIPSSFQSHEGTNFHGIGWYRRALKLPPVPKGHRALLHFQAAATEAAVWFNGERLGSHLGGWTPFRFDITELLGKGRGATAHEIRVRLDEKVGHNTQGFLPIIAPHFGGLWQGVSVLVVPETFIDDLLVLAHGDPKTGRLKLELPLNGPNAKTVSGVSLRYRPLPGPREWAVLPSAATNSGCVLQVAATIPNHRVWSTAEPNLYELEISLQGRRADRVRTRLGFRSIEAFGQQLRLNGQPLQIRGLLNWGYSAPQVEPNPGEDVWRQELQFARSCGFNMMKFCLWIPPKRYLELADEMGMLTWMEYPTWHPDFSEKHLEPLRREFREFFAYDRNHPSVMLRSLTCETGPSASLKVLRSLYDEAHAMIPGALVEDDSSWIGWNRVHDFYDDHPYGNNHNWVPRLHGFNEHILAHGLKPLVLGESISADTWPGRESLLQKLGTERPWWAPGVLDDMPRWTERMRQLAGPGGLERLAADSLRYGMLMRKYQAEAFRREVPYGGYVISVIRDVPNASMGLLDYLGRPKWREADWGWQRDTMCLLKTESDRRSYAAGEMLRGEVLLSHFGRETITHASLEVSLNSPGAASTALKTVTKTNLQQNPGTLATLTALDWPLPEVSEPRQFLVRAVLENSSTARFTNEWPLWVTPKPPTNALFDVRLHNSVDSGLAGELFPGCREYRAEDETAGIVVASRLDDNVARCLEAGGRVFLIPNGQRYSLPLSAHWFLRGAPYIPERPLNKQVPRELLVELQHFDLAADVVPNVPQLDSLDPILLLWDTHDQKDTVKTHGVIFETRVGKGRMLVSAARHGGATNSAGRWLLSVLLEHLRAGPAPKHALPDNVWNHLKARLHAEQVNLANHTWQFHPDPADEGLEKGWHLAGQAGGADWKQIRVGAWWESQGYPALDKWAWYRLEVEIPSRWQGLDVFLSFEGVDDVYELYVGGKLAGKGGDLATRKDALQERRSHNISTFVRPGQKALIAVRVHDWYGAGGIFRPVTLGTQAFAPSLDFLK